MDRAELTYLNDTASDALRRFKGYRIGVFAGSFRIPYIYDQLVAQELGSKVDQLVYIISGISVDSIDKRQLSVSNLKQLATLMSDYPDFPPFARLAENAENLTYAQLKPVLKKAVAGRADEKLKDRIRSYMNSLQNRLYSSIDFYCGAQLTGQAVRDMMRILQVDARFVISAGVSPVMKALQYVNKLDGRMICLVSLGQSDGRSVWETLKDNFDQKNQIVEYWPLTKAPARREQVLQGIDTSEAVNWYRSESQLNNIRQYLAGLARTETSAQAGRIFDA